MTSRLATARLVVALAWRNLLASPVKLLIVGGIVFFAALLVVVGTSVVESLNSAMTRSIVGAAAGDLQVYSARSKGELAVMGDLDVEGADLATIDDYAALKKVLLTAPNVKEVVPMGIRGGLIASGNAYDVAFGRLRTLANTKADMKSEVAHVRHMLQVLKAEVETASQVQDERAVSGEDRAALARATSAEFWAGFNENPLDSLEFLENQVAPLSADGDVLFIRYVGTNPDAFARAFQRMRVVDGSAIPSGQRGILFSKWAYEDQIKLKTARRLDQIRQSLHRRGAHIATDAALKTLVTQNAEQTRDILLQLDEQRLAVFREKLQAHLASKESDVARLLRSFLSVTDDNFDARYAFFYRELAPMLELYRIRIGDKVNIKAFSASGYVRTTTLRVFGTYQFTGMEDSPLAGDLSVMDLVSFRELYGLATNEKQSELQALSASVAVRDVSREAAEAELFAVAESSSPEGSSRDTNAALSELGNAPSRSLDARYDAAELERGPVFNVAVLLRDPTALATTQADLRQRFAQAGLDLKVVPWQEASGMLGQFSSVTRGVLFTALLILFVIATVILSGAMVLSTLERVRDIGTLRAIGAQRRFILAVVSAEALLTGLVFAGLGTGVGALIVVALGRNGIPAANDMTTFFFSGPRLAPSLHGGGVGLALASVVVVTALASLYPVALAMRVSPLRAMQTEG